MNKEAMKQQIQEALSKKLGDGFRVSIQKVLKTNVKLDGLTIVKDGDTITPTIYLELFYNALNDGASIDAVTNRILQIYSSSKIYPEHFDTAPFLHFELPVERLYAVLINRHLNEELLQNVPHALFLDDFAVIVRCKVEGFKNNASFLVNNTLLNMWETDSETILAQAVKNMQTSHDAVLIPLEQLLKELIPSFSKEDEPLSNHRMWIITNKNRWFGAAAVLSDDVLKSFAEKYGSFYAIFSSVHEVLIIPSSDDSDIDSFTKLNQDINATTLAEDEILGTKVYFYQKDRGFVL